MRRMGIVEAEGPLRRLLWSVYRPFLKALRRHSFSMVRRTDKIPEAFPRSALLFGPVRLDVITCINRSQESSCGCGNQVHVDASFRVLCRSLGMYDMIRACQSIRCSRLSIYQNFISARIQSILGSNQHHAGGHAFACPSLFHPFFYLLPIISRVVRSSSRV